MLSHPLIKNKKRITYKTVNKIAAELSIVAKEVKFEYENGTNNSRNNQINQPNARNTSHNGNGLCGDKTEQIIGDKVAHANIQQI